MVQTELQTGKCEHALQLTQNHLAEHPDDAPILRLNGDAHRCLDHGRQALMAYQAAKEGGVEGLDGLIQQVGATLATLRVKVVKGRANSPYQVQLLNGDETMPHDEGGLVFTNLPTETPLRVILTGTGYARGEWTIDPLKPGQTQEFTATANYVGFGTIDLHAGSAILTVSLEDASQRLDDLPPGTVDVTAGDVIIRVKGHLGESQRTLHVAAKQTTTVDLQALAPARLQLSNVPAGATVTLTHPDTDQTIDRQTPWDLQPIDPTIGLGYQPMIELDGLCAGTWNYTVEHRLLGTQSGQIEIVGDTVAQLDLPRTQAPGWHALETAYADYHLAKRQHARSRRRVFRNRALAIGGTTLALGATSYLAQSSASAYNEALTKEDDYIANLETGAINSAMDDITNRDDARHTATLHGAAAGGGALLTGMGVVLTVRSFKKKHDTSAAPVWAPETLVLPTAQPAASGQPAETQPATAPPTDE